VKKHRFELTEFFRIFSLQEQAPRASARLPFTIFGKKCEKSCKSENAASVGVFRLAVNGKNLKKFR